MDRKEILERLPKLNIDIVPRTLQRYVREGLIPAPIYPKRGQGARADFPDGADYPDEIIGEIYAAHKLLKEEKLTYEQAREAREIERYLKATEYKTLSDLLRDKKLLDLIAGKPKAVFYAFEWWRLGWEGIEKSTEKEINRKGIAILIQNFLSPGGYIRYRGSLIALADIGSGFLRMITELQI